MQVFDVTDNRGKALTEDEEVRAAHGRALVLIDDRRSSVGVLR